MEKNFQYLQPQNTTKFVTSQSPQVLPINLYGQNNSAEASILHFQISEKSGNVPGSGKEQIATQYRKTFEETLVQPHFDGIMNSLLPLSIIYYLAKRLMPLPPQ